MQQRQCLRGRKMANLRLAWQFSMRLKTATLGDRIIELKTNNRESRLGEDSLSAIGLAAFDKIENCIAERQDNRTENW